MRPAGHHVLRQKQVLAQQTTRPHRDQCQLQAVEAPQVRLMQQGLDHPALYGWLLIRRSAYLPTLMAGVLASAS